MKERAKRRWTAQRQRPRAFRGGRNLFRVPTLRGKNVQLLAGPVIRVGGSDIGLSTVLVRDHHVGYEENFLARMSFSFGSPCWVSRCPESPRIQCSVAWRLPFPGRLKRVRTSATFFYFFGWLYPIFESTVSWTPSTRQEVQFLWSNGQVSFVRWFGIFTSCAEISVYTGYLDVDAGAKHLFFYFFESRRDPAKGEHVTLYPSYLGH